MHFSHSDRLLLAAIVAMVLTMVWPAIFRLPARLWFGFSHILGTVISKILLSVVFFVVVSPIGLFRKLIGKDAMKMKQWKKGPESAFRSRDQVYRAEDLEKPY